MSSCCVKGAFIYDVGQANSNILISPSPTVGTMLCSLQLAPSLSDANNKTENYSDYSGDLSEEQTFPCLIFRWFPIQRSPFN